MKIRRAVPLLLLLALLPLASCGYGLVGRGSNLPPGIKAVYLKPLDNRTPRSQSPEPNE